MISAINFYPFFAIPTPNENTTAKPTYLIHEDTSRED